jgi:hypothetical protein
MPQNARRLSIVLLVLVVLTTALYAWIGNPFDPFDDRRFSSDAWINAPADARAHMARDIIRRIAKPGTSETEVIEMLGKPDDVSNRRGPGGKVLNGIRIYEYRIGNWPLWRMDDAFLYVYLDTSEHVVKSEIYGY